MWPWHIDRVGFSKYSFEKLSSLEGKVNFWKQFHGRKFILYTLINHVENTHNRYASDKYIYMHVCDDYYVPDIVYDKFQLNPFVWWN